MWSDFSCCGDDDDDCGVDIMIAEDARVPKKSDVIKMEELSSSISWLQPVSLVGS